jgi:hypothetical protein
MRQQTTRVSWSLVVTFGLFSCSDPADSIGQEAPSIEERLRAQDVVSATNEDAAGDDQADPSAQGGDNVPARDDVMRLLAEASNLRGVPSNLIDVQQVDRDSVFLSYRFPADGGAPAVAMFGLTPGQNTTTAVMDYRSEIDNLGREYVLAVRSGGDVAANLFESSDQPVGLALPAIGLRAQQLEADDDRPREVEVAIGNDRRVMTEGDSVVMADGQYRVFVVSVRSPEGSAIGSEEGPAYALRLKVFSVE